MKNVLIVDDNVGMRSALRSFLTLKAQLHVCGEAADGVEAIERAKEYKPDLILMDLAMPRMSGIEAASVIKTIMPQIRIVVFTLHGQLIGKGMTKVLGVDLVLSKSDGTAGLTEALQRLLFETSDYTPAIQN